MLPKTLIETEEEIHRLWEAGEIPSLLHLEGSVDGSYEQWLCDFFRANVREGDWIFASHRCHFVYQLHGGKDIIEKIKAGKSMFLYDHRFVCSAIVGGAASIAAGMALSIKLRGGDERVWCFSGDGSEDGGHFYESVRLVHGKKLPCTFIITDNNSSCGATKELRGSPDDWQWPDCVIRVKYEPKWPHAGSYVRPQLKWTK